MIGTSDLFNAMFEHLHVATFNPFLNGEKNGLKNVTCKRPLSHDFQTGSKS